MARPELSPATCLLCRALIGCTSHHRGRARRGAGKRLLLIDEIDRSRASEAVANVGTAMMTAEPMIARGAHYTALLDTIDHRGATKPHSREREQLLEAADALLFGEPDSEWAVGQPRSDRGFAD